MECSDCKGIERLVKAPPGRLNGSLVIEKGCRRTLDSFQRGVDSIKAVLTCLLIRMETQLHERKSERGLSIVIPSFFFFFSICLPINVINVDVIRQRLTIFPPDRMRYPGVGARRSSDAGQLDTASGFVVPISKFVSGLVQDPYVRSWETRNFSVFLFES